MAETKKIWRGIVIPYEYFRSYTKGGAVVFQVDDYNDNNPGDFHGYSFVRPATTVFKAIKESAQGFNVGYSVEQTLEGGDVVEEAPETVKLRKSVKNDNGRWEVEDEFEVEMPQIADLIDDVVHAKQKKT